MIWTILGLVPVQNVHKSRRRGAFSGEITAGSGTGRDRIKNVHKSGRHGAFSGEITAGSGTERNRIKNVHKSRRHGAFSGAILAGAAKKCARNNFAHFSKCKTASRVHFFAVPYGSNVEVSVFFRASRKIDVFQGKTRQPPRLEISLL